MLLEGSHVVVTHEIVTFCMSVKTLSYVVRPALIGLGRGLARNVHNPQRGPEFCLLPSMFFREVGTLVRSGVPGGRVVGGRVVGGSVVGGRVVGGRVVGGITGGAV